MDFTPQELQVLGQCISRLTQSGQLKPEELVPVGLVFNKIVASLNAEMENNTEEENSVNDEETNND